MHALWRKPLSAAVAFVALGLWATAMPAQAQMIGGGLQLAPTSVTLGPQGRGAEVFVRNMGSEAVTYRIEIGSSVPSANGGTVFATNAGTLGAMSAAPMIVASPRQVTVGPGEAQTIRIALRRPADLLPGTYTARLRAQALPPEQVAAAGQAATGDSVTIGLRAIYGASIPIRVTHQ